jgi:16S rRNA (adenine1518-N6/adenine1519-N6)-dimethyltransferase
VPKVTSAIIRLVIEPERRAVIQDLQYFHQITKALFLHRRKFLRANMLAAMKRHLDKDAVDAILDEMGFAVDTRTEQLDVATLIALSDKLRAVAPDWKL